MFAKCSPASTLIDTRASARSWPMAELYTMTDRAGPADVAAGATPLGPFARWARRAWPWLSAAAGLLLATLLANTLGAQQVRTALWSMARYLPIMGVLEIMRFSAELQSTRRLLATPIPWRALMQAQCAAHACGQVMPAGRAAGESIKSAVLAPHVGATRAGAVGAAGQLITLIVNGALSLLAAVVTVLTGESPELALALGLFGGALLALGALLTLALRRPRPFRRLRSMPITGTLLERIAEAARHGAHFGPTAVLWQMTARLMQAVQLGVLISAIRGVVSVPVALVSLGVHLLGAAAGDFLPAHMGTTEGAFALTASVMHIAPSSALSVALVLHAVQLIFTGLTLVMAVLLRLLRNQHHP